MADFPLACAMTNAVLADFRTDFEISKKRVFFRFVSDKDVEYVKFAVLDKWSHEASDSCVC